MNARVIQHEYDHIEGTLFLEHLKPIKRRLLKRKLENIKRYIESGKVTFVEQDVQDFIEIEGAYKNNLQNITVKIVKNQILN